MLPLAVASLLGSLYTLFEGDVPIGNYYLFWFVYLLSIAVLSTATITYVPGRTRLLALGLGAISAAFYAVPGLVNFGSSKYAEALPENIDLDDLANQEEGLRGSLAIR